MLDDKTIGTGPATIPWFAARDANMRSEAAKGLFSPAAHLKAERMRMALSTCYKGDKFHITSHGVTEAKRTALRGVLNQGDEE